MSELSPAAKQLLATARDGLGPDPATIARLEARIAAGAVATGHARVGSAARTAVAAKSAGGLVVLGALASVLVLANRSEPEPSLPPRASPAPTTTAAIEPAIPIPPPAPSTPASASSHLPVVLPPAHARAVKLPPSLAREVELLDSAHRALTSGDVESARSWVHTYQRETGGRGQLEEDASALDVELACRARDVTAAAALAEFDARWPHSVLRARLVTACGAE